MALLIVGLDNPQSRDPRFALFPAPAGCAGARLYEMMLEIDGEFTRHQYIHIPKTNLFPVGPFARKFASEAGSVLRVQIADVGWHAVLCGNQVADAVAAELRDTVGPCEWVDCGDGEGKVAWIPHPSGRNRFYNNKRNRLKVGEFLIEEYKR